MGDSALKRKTVKGFFWGSLESLLSQGQGIIFGVILARVLSPTEFGLIGMIAIFISISHVFIDSGLSQSLIRKLDCSINDFSTVFWVNLSVALVSYAILWITAPLIADFYGKPELILLTRVSSLAIIFGAFTLIQQTILIKEVDFKTLTKSSTISTFVSGTASVLLAIYGFGVWSLVWKSLIFQFTRSAILWYQNKWYPDFYLSKPLLREHFAFGSNILIISLIGALFKNISNLIIGKSYSEKILGYYTNADQYSSTLSNTISSITNKVSYPVLAEIQHDGEKLRAAINKLITRVMYISFVCMFGLIAMAKPLFIVVLGEKWLPSVAIFQVLCLGYVITPMHVINQNIMKIKGRSDYFLRTEIFKYIIFTPFLILGVIYGIKVLIAAIAFFYWIAYVVNAYYSRKLIGYSVIEQSIDFLPVMAIAVIPALITWSLGFVFHDSNLLLLGIQIVTYPGLVIILSIIFKVPAFFEIRQILADRINVADFLKTLSSGQ